MKHKKNILIKKNILFELKILKKKKLKKLIESYKILIAWNKIKKKKLKEGFNVLEAKLNKIFLFSTFNCSSLLELNEYLFSLKHF